MLRFSVDVTILLRNGHISSTFLDARYCSPGRAIRGAGAAICRPADMPRHFFSGAQSPPRNAPLVPLNFEGDVTK